MGSNLVMTPGPSLLLASLIIIRLRTKFINTQRVSKLTKSCHISLQNWKPWNPGPELAAPAALRSPSRLHSQEVLEADQGRRQGHPEQAPSGDAGGSAEA